MADKYFKQCTFESGNTWTVAWIDEKAAVMGNSVHFSKSEDPGRIWRVTEVGSIRQSSQWMKERERITRRYKSNTDV